MAFEALAHQPANSALRGREWTNLGLAKDKLLEEAESLYWAALNLEIAGAALSLNTMISQIPLIEELTEDSTEFLALSKRLSIRMLPFIKAWWPFSDEDTSNGADKNDVDILRQVLLGQGDFAGAKGHQDKPPEYRLARMLLSGLGILDIDKLIEYRRPQYPSQCGEPQLAIFQNRVQQLKGGSMDVQFTYLNCNDCGKVFRAAYYECSEGCHHRDWEDTEEVFAVCAQCYQTTDHNIQHLRKRTIHHPFTEAVAKELCQCPGVDNPLKVVIDFPHPERWEGLFEERQRQKQTLEGHRRGCQYLAMEFKRLRVIDTVNETEDKECEEMLKKRLKEQNRNYHYPLKNKALKIFPKFIRSRLFPAGNAHVSVMFGPLIIENGVLDTQEGAVISCREPPNLGTPYRSLKGIALPQADGHLDRILVVSGDKSRSLMSTADPSLRKRKLNGSIKQCLGGLFSGHDQSWEKTENKTILKFLCLSKAYSPGLTREYNKSRAKKLLGACSDLIEPLKEHIGPTVRMYLHRLLHQLWDPAVPLAWSQTFNNCQTFCDKLVLQGQFSTCFPLRQPGLNNPDNTNTELNYLFSFCARFPSQSEEAVIVSRLDEYFRSFHQEFDIIDHFRDLEEGVSSGPLKCQNILLWDCATAACSLPDHIWLHPYESISILFFHVLRNYEMYSNYDWPGSTDNTAPAMSRMSKCLNTRQWLRQRISVLQGIDILLSSLGALARVFSQMAQNQFTAEERSNKGLLRMGQKAKNVWMWGEWKPGRSDVVGRHGPENMANFEEGEILTAIIRS
ncbi:hypothetical protein NXS19_000005 [Fusarium pseudograminearum]|nr:hypothetical protein NXS19_000005 [Fusarium pseudograminearum]